MTGKHEDHHVTDAEATAVLAYATSVMRTLGMANWVLDIQEAPCQDDAHASVCPVYGRRVGMISLATEWMDLSDDVRRNTITHEVLHLVHSRLDDVIGDTEDLLHDYEYRAFHRRYKREMELIVDHLATFMADTHKLAEKWDEAHNPEGEK